MSDGNNTFQDATITALTDEDGRTLNCFIEQTLTVEEQTYVLLMPINSPIEIFAWEDEDETLVDIEDEEIETIFTTAKAVLAELDLILQNSAHTLTAAGQIPDPEDESCFTLEIEEENEGEPTSDNFQMLATFYHDDQQYTICTPLEPLLFFARYDPAVGDESSGKAILLSPEEFKVVQPYLEDQLFEGLE